MSINSNINIGWILVLREDLRADACYDMEGDWDDFIVGTDPICGRTNHICVFNRTRDSKHYNTEDEGLVEFDAVRRPLSDNGAKFVEAFKKAYGEDSIKLTYGMVVWYS